MSKSLPDIAPEATEAAVPCPPCPSRRTVDDRRRMVLKGGLATIGALSSALNAACGGGASAAEQPSQVSPPSPPTPPAPPAPLTPPAPPAPPAPPPPAPAPPPPPAPAPASNDPSFPTARSVNPALAIVFIDYLEGGTYERFQDITLMSGASWVLRFKGMALPAGGDRVLAGTTYRLLVDGVERASTTVAAGTKIASFTLPLAGLSEGWRWLDIATDTAETPVPWVAYMQQGGTPATQPKMPVVLGSYGLRGNHSSLMHTAMVPARFAPVTIPYAPRETPAFAEALPRTSLVHTEVVPWRIDDVHRPRTTNGVLCSFNQQAYFFTSLASAKYPGLALLDGPRGHGSLAMATHLQIGRTGGVYFCDAWRIGFISPNGTIRTIAGFRHPSPAPRPFPQDEATLKKEVELVGDWSAIPATRHGFHELWGLAWDARTLVVNEAATPIPNNDTLEKPHLVGPRAFVADSQNNRVCKLEFNPVNHDAPVKVTEFITGLHDPWDVICVEGVLYVSERLSHRIAAYDASTGAFLTVVVSGAALAGLTSFRTVQRLVPLATIRAEKCVAPEGMYHLDGWLYFGSVAMAQIKRIHLTTGELQTVVADAYYDAGSNFFKIAVSDGTFGPRGAVFYSSWSITNGGRPLAYLPDGTPWPYSGFTRGGEGPGPVWDSLGYGSAVAVGQGRMVCSTSTEGLGSHSKALPADAPVTWAKTKAGRDAYFQRGLQITHGPGGWGYYGLPMPWGVTPEIDYYLTTHGHKRV